MTPQFACDTIANREMRWIQITCQETRQAIQPDFLKEEAKLLLRQLSRRLRNLSDEIIPQGDYSANLTTIEMWPDRIDKVFLE